MSKLSVISFLREIEKILEQQQRKYGMPKPSEKRRLGKKNHIPKNRIFTINVFQ